MDIRNRMEMARYIMKEEGIDCLVLAPSTDLCYMTAFDGISMERPVFLILTQEKAGFVIPEFELENLSPNLKEQVICIPWKEQEDPYGKAAQFVQGDNIAMAAMGNQMPAIMFYHLQKTFPRWEWYPGNRIMSRLRSQKEEEEYTCLAIAQKGSGRALIKLLEEGISGKTELEVALRLKEHIQDEGLLCNGTPLVAAGANSALPHHGAGHTVIQKGDSVIIDFGGCYKGYYSDITRTVVVEEAPQGFAEIYHIVREANEASAAAAKPGITGEQLDAIAREIIENSGYGAYFTHRLGHGIGLDIHEEPYIVKGNHVPLTAGNVFSNEPGIYVPGQFGVRLEDVLFLREGQAECLTELTHDILTTK